MCRRVTCRACSKPTYAGCGQHVDQVLAGVPAKARCSCPKPRGLVARLLRRRMSRRSNTHATWPAGADWQRVSVAPGGDFCGSRVPRAGPDLVQILEDEEKT